METDILRKVHHPNIIELKGVFETDEYLFLIMEMVTGGELFDKIIEKVSFCLFGQVFFRCSLEKKGCYTEKEAATLVGKIVSAIDYLHSLDICHRDLKPENLLLASPDLDTEVKIADFGLSKIINTKVMMQTACGKFVFLYSASSLMFLCVGTPGYVAPEVLSATGYDKEVDMWSIGVITYILLCGFPPFYGETVPEVGKKNVLFSFCRLTCSFSCSNRLCLLTMVKNLLLLLLLLLFLSEKTNYRLSGGLLDGCQRSSEIFHRRTSGGESQGANDNQTSMVTKSLFLVSLKTPFRLCNILGSKTATSERAILSKLDRKWPVTSKREEKRLQQQKTRSNFNEERNSTIHFFFFFWTARAANLFSRRSIYIKAFPSFSCLRFFFAAFSTFFNLSPLPTTTWRSISMGATLSSSLSKAASSSSKSAFSVTSSILSSSFFRCFCSSFSFNQAS
jgi:serine/threonine protein kinase